MAGLTAFQHLVFYFHKLLYPRVQQTLVFQGLLFIEALRSQSDTTWLVGLLCPSQRPLPSLTQ